MTKELLKEILIQYLESHKIITVVGCWETGLVPEASGYARTIIHEKHYLIHRISAYIYHGLDLDDLTQLALHKNSCNNRACWNPDHIYVGNAIRNAKDRDQIIEKSFGQRTGEAKRNRTHCDICGFPYDEKNTLKRKTGRDCRNCENRRKREFRTRKKLKIEINKINQNKIDK